MSEPLAERLSRFTPDAAGLNRDALLFAAGRASVRPHHRWKLLALVLAASQALTLTAFWPRTPPSSTVAPLAVPEESAPLAASETHSITDAPEMDLSERLLSRSIHHPEPLREESLVPPDPPLHAFGPPPAAIIN